MAAIPVRITTRYRQRSSRYQQATRPRVLTDVNINKSGPPRRRIVPAGFVLNARSLVKPDASAALYLELTNNNVDFCIITETWLKPAIPSHLVCPNGFSMIRKDRENRQGGGVAVICRNDWKLERLHAFQNPYECLWAKISTPNSEYYVAAVYHPPSPEYSSGDFLDFLIDAVERLLSFTPNARLIIAGDVNQLDINCLLNQHSLAQIVKIPTRGVRTLDVFITNFPQLWSKVRAINSLVRSDHLAVLVKPVQLEKSSRKTIEFRDCRDHNKLKMFKKIENCPLDSFIMDAKCPNEMITRFYEKVWPLFNECFPIIKVRTSNRDPPFLSPIIKHLLKQRKNAKKTHDVETNHRLQENINQLIRKNQLKAVNQNYKDQTRGSKRWWSVVNGITGRSNSEVPISSLLDPQVINMYFQSINTDSNYTDPVPLTIPEGTRFPKISIYSVVNLLLKQKPTAAGPDDLPYWFWRDYAYDLAPVITKIFNSSLQNGVIPDLWKLANLLPIPKVSPLTECSQLRPISLTNIIMRLFERTIYINELSQVMEDEIHKDQFAYRKNHSSTTALIKAQHTWLEWLGRGAKMVRVFSFDFKKAFDSVPHDVLCDKIKNLPINPYVINWMINFLKNRYQRVCVDGIKTEYLPINRGVPQGTVLGPLLFSIMINDIKLYWTLISWSNLLTT